MRKIRDILRLDAQGCPNRTIAHSVGTGETTVRECLSRARKAGLVWPLPDDLDDTVLESRLYPSPIPSGAPRPEPDWATIHQELKRPHVTLMLLWQEYKAQHPDGYLDLARSQARSRYMGCLGSGMMFAFLEWWE